MKSKIAALTYHRINDGTTSAQFYDVPANLFCQQVETIARYTKRVDRKPVVPIICFDDGTADHLKAAEILSQAGLIGVFFIVIRRIGLAGYLDASQIRDMSSMGHIIGSHTYSHRKLTFLSPQDQEEEIQNSRGWLEQFLGCPVEWFAPPGGAIDETGLRIAQSSGYRFVRTMRWGYTEITSDPTEVLSAIPVLPNLSLKGLDKILNGDATFFSYRLKQTLKYGLGEKSYTKLRDKFMNIRRSRDSGAANE